MASSASQSTETYTAEEDLSKALHKLRQCDLAAGLLALFNNQEEVVSPWAADHSLLATKTCEFLIEMGVELLLDKLSEDTIESSCELFHLGRAAADDNARLRLELHIKQCGMQKIMKQMRVGHLRNWCHDVGIDTSTLKKSSLANALATESVLLGTETFFYMQLFQTLSAFAESLGTSTSGLFDKRDLIDALMTSIYHLFPSSPSRSPSDTRLPNAASTVSDDCTPVFVLPPKVAPIDIENTSNQETKARSTDYSKLTVAELRKLLSRRGLDATGLKRDLIERLTQAGATPAKKPLATKNSRIPMRQAVANPRSSKKSRS